MLLYLNFDGDIYVTNKRELGVCSDKWLLLPIWVSIRKFGKTEGNGLHAGPVSVSNL